jgi:hypothetical protein
VQVGDTNWNKRDDVVHHLCSGNLLAFWAQESRQPFNCCQQSTICIRIESTSIRSVLQWLQQEYTIQHAGLTFNSIVRAYSYAACCYPLGDIESDFGQCRSVCLYYHWDFHIVHTKHLFKNNLHRNSNTYFITHITENFNRLPRPL